MAKKKHDEGLREFDVYKQADGALVVLEGTTAPEDDDAELVWGGRAKDERDAIKQARKSVSSLKKAPVADSSFDPDFGDTLRKEKEARINERLGITPRAEKKKSAKKKTSAAKSRAKKTGARTGTKRTARRAKK